jgi:hypothetical protein
MVRRGSTWFDDMVRHGSTWFDVVRRGSTTWFDVVRRHGSTTWFEEDVNTYILLHFDTFNRHVEISKRPVCAQVLVAP